MFRTYNLHTHDISLRNLILLFLTIVLGFASLIVLGAVEIPSVIDNAQQTIAKISITDDGTDMSPRIEFSSGGIFIDEAILTGKYNFSGKVLGIDDLGNVIYVTTDNLVVSGAGGGGGGDGFRTGILGGDIYNLNSNHVGIGNASPTSGKLHITSTADTELALEETNPGNAASIHFINQTRTWTIGGDGTPDIFYIGVPGTPFVSVLGMSGYVGIGTTGPKAPLQVIGNFIAGGYNNTISGTNSSIGGGGQGLSLFPNKINGNNSFIGGGIDNFIVGTNSFVGGGNSNHNTGARNVIAGGLNNSVSGLNLFIGGGFFNTIEGNYSSIGGGTSNSITGGSTYSFIGGGYSNSITSGSDYSTIAGGRNNNIIGSDYSFVGGRNANALHNNSFVWNTDGGIVFQTIKEKTFIINALSGVGIRTNDPKGDLHIAGKGVIVFEPQASNPQGGAGTQNCSITGSVAYSLNKNKLCYCNGSLRALVEGGDCIF